MQINPKLYIIIRINYLLIEKYIYIEVSNQ